MAERFSIEFTSPAGESLRFDWSADALGSFDAGDAEPAWSLGGEVDWGEIERIRVLSGRLGDGVAVGIATLVPRGAAGHGEGPIAGLLVADGEPEQLGEVLLSVEHGPDGAARRVGLEFYRGEGAMPLRMAGDATSTDSSTEGPVARERVALQLRSAGVEGVGVLETLEAA